MTGVDVTLWTARAAAAGYAVAVAVLLTAEAGGADGRRARAWWTAGAAVFVAHVAAAFALVPGWSHADALVSTARQTAALTGLSTGAGLYLNYAFGVVWLIDVVWWWAAPRSRAARPAVVAWAVHGFMAFMMFNATVVFGRWPYQLIYAAAAAGLAALWLRTRR